MSWLIQPDDRADDFETVFGMTPGAYARFRVLYASLWNPKALDLGVLELCRLRVAALLGCASETQFRVPEARSSGLPEAKIAALPLYPSSPLFSELERRCLAYVEQYVLDPHGLEDRDFELLREHLNDAQISALTLAAAVFDALARFRLGLGLDDTRSESAGTGANRSVQRDPSAGAASMGRKDR